MVGSSQTSTSGNTAIEEQPGNLLSCHERLYFLLICDHFDYSRKQAIVCTVIFFPFITEKEDEEYNFRSCVIVEYNGLAKT